MSTSTPTRPAALAVLTTVATACLSLCLGAAAVNTSAGPPEVSMPTATSASNTSMSWAIVVMGKNDGQNDLFPELFSLASSTGRWQLATPPGVADNGGLFIGAGENQSLLVGIGADLGLSFSPLALTNDGGKNWTPGVLSEGLVRSPSALALGTSVAAAIVSDRHGQSVLRTTNPSATWGTLSDDSIIRAGIPGCGLTSLTAVGIAARASVIVGGACGRGGSIPLFHLAGSRWRAEPARIPASMSSSSFETLRLSGGGPTPEAIFAARSAKATEIVAGWAGGSDQPWTLSSGLTLNNATRVVALGGGLASTQFIVTRTDGTAHAWTAEGPGLGWRLVGILPPGTVSIAFEPDGTLDALVVDTSTLTIWRQTHVGGTFERVQKIVVPIQYGSSA